MEKMEIISIKNKSDFLKEYFTLCNLEWGEPVNENDMEEYLAMKEEKALNGDKFISILGLVENNCLLGFIALFKYEDGQDRNLTPWYASMYVKKEYRGRKLAAVLVRNLTIEILKHGKIPFYSASVTNIASQAVAVRAGYMPLWTDTFGTRGI